MFVKENLYKYERVIERIVAVLLLIVYSSDGGNMTQNERWKMRWAWS